MSDDFEFEPISEESEDFGFDEPKTQVFDNEPVEDKMTVVRESKDLSSKSSEFDFDFSNIPGVVVGDIGIEISRFPVERAKFTQDSKALISIVTDKVICLKTHYRESLGNYICWGGKCCDIDGLSRVRYLFPIVRYDTDKRGAPVSTNLEYQVLSVGKDVYEDIRTNQELNGSITDFDLLITCKDPQYQKISLSLAGSARWKKNKKLVSQVRDFWSKHLKDIIKPVARSITEQDLLKDEKVAEGIESNGNVDFDSVFSDD